MSRVNWVLLSITVTKAVCPSTWFITLFPTLTVVLKFWLESINLKAVVAPSVVPASTSPPPLVKVGVLVAASQDPLKIKPLEIEFIWDCTFPNASSIVSEGSIFPAAGVGSPVRTFATTAEFNKVTAPLTLLVPSTLEIVPVASLVKDKSLAVSHLVAVSAFPVKSPVTFPVTFTTIVEGKLIVAVWQYLQFR